MVDPVFQMFPEEGPLRLAAGSPPSAPVAFNVGAQLVGMFLRVITIGTGCEPPGEAAPGIELRVATGDFAPVPREPDTVTIRDDSQTPVATASWTPEPRGIILIRLDITKPSDLPWHMRITNKAPVELRFVWVASDLEEDTRQPRLLMERSHARQVLVGQPVDDIVVSVADVGTGELHIDTPAGTDLGDGFLLDEVTRTLHPNECGHLTIKVPHVEFTPFGTGRHSTDFTLAANTRHKEERTLHLSVSEKFSKEKEKEHKEKEGKDGKDKEHKDTPQEVMMFGDLLPTPLAPLVAWAGDTSPHVHFIPPELRPDVSTSALVHEDPAP